MSLSENYREAGFAARVGWGRSPAVIVVDVCLAYLDPASPLFADAEPARAAMEELVNAAREAAIPVVFTRVEYSSEHPAGVFGEKVPALKLFNSGNPMADFPEAPRPSTNEKVITKQQASAFFDTELHAHLIRLGVDTTVVCGFSTSGCVRATTVDAIAHGYRPIVVREACGDRDPAPHEQSLFDLDAKYADVVTLKDAIEHLTRRSE